MNIWVLVSEIENGGIWCHGIYDKYETALGMAVEMIWESKESCPEDYFGFSEAEPTEGDGGYVITVKHENYMEYYFILKAERGDKWLRG